MRRRPDYTVTVESEHNLITGIDWGGGEGHDPMTITDEIHALATRHTPALSDALNATWPRPFSTGYTALLKLRRVRH
jgi:hypothetical protein